MADTPSPAPCGHDEDAFAALVLRYLDGLATADETARLNAALLSGDSYRQLFVRLCRLDGLLREVFVPLHLPLAVSERQAARNKQQAGATGDKTAPPAGTATAGHDAGDRGPAPAEGATGRATKLLAEDTAFPGAPAPGETPPDSAGTGTAPGQPDELLRLLGMLDEESEQTE